MKVDGITLLQMIKDGKIKDNTLIEVSGGTHAHLPYVIFGENKRLYWAHCKTNLQGVVISDELIEYEFEIIEENIKKIELDDDCFIDYDNTGRHLITTNRKDRNIYMPKINWLIEKVNYLLKKEDDK